MNEIWAKLGVGIFALTMYGGAFVIAYLAKSDTSLTLLMGSAATMAGAVINYYFGSSSSSDKKTDIIASQNPSKPPLAAP